MSFTLDPLVAVAILGGVNFVKALGLSGRVLTLISMLIGVVFAVLASILPAEVVQVGLVGILSGLGASGFYDFAGMLAPGAGGKTA